MNSLKTSAENKASARGQLIGKYGVFIYATLLLSFIKLLFSRPTLVVSDSGNILFYIIQVISSIFIVLIVSLFTVGLNRMYMMAACNRPVLLGELFYSFRNNTKTIIGVTLRYYAIILLPSLFASFVTTFAFTMKQPVIYFFACIFIVAMLAVIVYLSLVFDFCFYIVVDFPHYTPKQVFELSAYLMKGQVLRKLYLIVSFIPLVLVCLLTFGIGFLWLKPYMNATMCNFYLNVVKYKSNVITE